MSLINENYSFIATAAHVDTCTLEDIMEQAPIDQSVEGVQSGMPLLMLLNSKLTLRLSLIISSYIASN